METAPRDILNGAASPFKKYLPYIMGGVLLIVALGVLYFAYWWWQQGSQTTSSEYRFTEMRQVFEEASERIQAGDQDGAQITLNQFLLSSDDVLEQEQTLLRMAHTALAQRPIESVEIYARVARDETFDPVIRAAALEEMGLLYLTKISDSNEFTEEIFAVDFLSSLRVPGDTELSYVQLLEYANDISPSMLASGYVAKYYAEQAESPSAEMVGTAVGNLETLKIAIEQAADTNPKRPLAFALAGVTEAYLYDVSGQAGYQKDAIEHILAAIKSYVDLMDLAQLSAESEEVRRLANGRGALDSGTIWREVLSAAVNIQESSPDITQKLVENYIEFLQSEYGVHELQRVRDTGSAIHDIVMRLSDTFPGLTNVLDES